MPATREPVRIAIFCGIEISTQASRKPCATPLARNSVGISFGRPDVQRRRMHRAHFVTSSRLVVPENRPGLAQRKISPRIKRLLTVKSQRISFRAAREQYAEYGCRRLRGSIHRTRSPVGAVEKNHCLDSTARPQDTFARAHPSPGSGFEPRNQQRIVVRGVFARFYRAVVTH